LKTGPKVKWALLFAKMKDTAFVINTARGRLIDDAAPIVSINSGNIAGVALDVLESETAATPVHSVLVNHSKIIITAHTAWLG
jgi:phosphoglycerate dehydrogenase-like enzyme